jgi:hypothetical protein
MAFRIGRDYPLTHSSASRPPVQAEELDASPPGRVPSRRGALPRYTFVSVADGLS